MELRAKVLYHSGLGTLEVGATTEGTSYTEEEKQQLLDTFPDWFEVIGKPISKVVDEIKVETPEDHLKVETPEDKLPKTRKK